VMILQSGPQLIWLRKLQGGIEAGRVDLNDLTDHAEQLLPLVKQWCKAGLLMNDDLLMSLTVSGRFWASNLLFALQKLLMQLNEPDLNKKQMVNSSSSDMNGHLHIAKLPANSALEHMKMSQTAK